MIGAVLAGGRGRRFGGDKLLFRISGKPLLLYTIERLEQAEKIDEIVLVASKENAEKLRDFGHDVVVDELMIGPMGGIFTALSLGDAFVVAGDMPLLVPEFIDFIVERFEEAKKPACVPRWSNGYLEPLHAAYSSSFRDFLEERIKSRNYAINQAIRESDACYIEIEKLPEGWRESFFNVNTREDLRRLTPLRTRDNPDTLR
ncbi:molybdopterin-guanine dinucleotide biosynthesis protein A [Thermococcus kodakarensis KOD1]|uniref:Probable molybdenum cofactor guanylyltransferase n=1 Tax=Thermococcus kodakarensis (strain ATCC BAA-918 / JCM 12380 / KOD1) TaxID=69014 RepID=MOBA_THEKO|nr:molybdenum cofactor guanylyltransferase MobA [Thermococcus kodakarensis]Q5JIH9.1 RecName: Full=Probable molybdenum cofactor guanylyltransferase; Short=MoCo guanylyltransferase; AltName: Full=GTP:molybdopterin guanylyltransferase; AltName: Full=Mo-MPT guanylyltransferase; AltName: Full=Molybdopterin guanylyltransferase; AltName: Full=Molybdopterin-guanine dinucleotide synthase; Short=MGD synthase [Thermococcus kodakarensis KOD1]WCN29431.1 molybdenum cofactor guanylyltransferase MobA [Thermococc